MKSYRLFLFERSFMFVLAVGLAFVLAPAAFAFVEDPCSVEASLAAPEPIAISGEWTAHLSSKDPSRIQLSFTRRTEKGGYNQSGNTMKLSDLQGLSGEISAPTRTDVSFKLAREAGTISMDGFFQGGRGAGLWTFTPNASFASSMASRGYANLTEEDLLRATFHNLTTKYADQIKAAGFDQLTFAQLSRAAVHDISVDYIRELRNSGFENLTMENIIRASNHDISAAYVKEVAAMGFANQPLDKVIRLKNHDISPAYISELKAAGFENLTLDEVVRMKNHDVSADFVNQVKGEGFANISSATIIRLKNHDVDREFIQRAKAQYPNATLEEMIRLKNNGSVK
jgi:uncharacterized protein (UPF0335 family)